jgi:hypothetical protein
MQIKKTKITEGEKHPSVGETPYNPKKTRPKKPKLTRRKNASALLPMNVSARNPNSYCEFVWQFTV